MAVHCNNIHIHLDILSKKKPMSTPNSTSLKFALLAVLNCKYALKSTHNIHILDITLYHKFNTYI